MNKLDPRYYAKAVIAFVTPGVVALVAAVQEASPGHSSVTGPEWVGILAACVLTGAGVFATPNRLTVPKGDDGGEDDGGEPVSPAEYNVGH